MSRHLSVVSSCAGALALLLLSTSAGAQTGVIECSVASLQPRAPAGTTVTAATVIAASGATPQHCQVDATVATPGNTVNFRLGLPSAWNNKFYFEGVGGFAGSIGSLRPGLARGYASASTDTGHQGGTTDASWALGNPAKRIDYGHRGTHVTAVAAKALSQAYYGSAPRFSYFNGCSNGGRQALMEAQRYPEDFDGLIAGNPALGTNGQVRRLLNYQAILSSPGRVVPASKLRLISQAAIASCDGRDGLVDGLISDPRACSFKPETLACTGQDGPACLTAGQVETVNAMYADMIGPGGTRLPGLPVGHEDGASGWQTWVTGADAQTRPDGTVAYGQNAPLGFRFMDGYMRYLAFEKDDPTFDYRTFSLDRHGAAVAAMADTYSPSDPTLAGLQTRGGKLLLYHGWADPGISATGTVNYYDAVVKAAGSRQKAEQFARLFMVPGMHHCQGNGPGPNTFDMLSALEAWVERGTAPTTVIASHATGGAVDRTRPLCAYPQVARYSGTGSIDAAASFRCEAPPPQQAPSSSASLAGPGAGRWTTPRTPWGDPDLQGSFTNKYETSTPFERPKEFEGRRIETVTATELADAVTRRQNDTLERAKFFGGDPEGRIGNSAEFRDIYEIDRGSRPWFVVDPPDGKIPPMAAGARERIAAMPRAGGSFGGGPFNSPADFGLWDRCITRGFPGSMLPGQYGNSYQIVQGPGFVAIRYEMVHDTRVIPLDSRPRPGSALQFDMGHARGHWDGDTLVVETTNFKARSVYRNGNPETLRIVERFTRTASDKVEWSVTVDDPSTWTRPWTFAMPLTMTDQEPVLEYACHEGNHGVANILSAARAAEREAEGKGSR